MLVGEVEAVCALIAGVWTMKRYAVLLCFLILTPSAFAQPDQAVVVGPWVITTTTKAGKFTAAR